jgi:hypothetical protein
MKRIGTFLILGAVLLSCTPTTKTTRSPAMFAAAVDTVPTGIPWLTPKPVVIFVFNYHPNRILHGYDCLYNVRSIYPFLWALSTAAGIARFGQMTGGNVPTPPVTIELIQTDGRPVQ